MKSFYQQGIIECYLVPVVIYFRLAINKILIRVTLCL